MLAYLRLEFLQLLFHLPFIARTHANMACQAFGYVGKSFGNRAASVEL